MALFYSPKGFIDAVSREDTGDVKRYVQHKKKAEWLGAKDERGSTTLHLAARKGYADITKLLAEGGVPANEKDAGGRTALELAAAFEQTYWNSWLNSSRRHDMVRALLAAGADPNICSTAWASPLRNAVGLGDADCVKMLLAAGADPNHGDLLETALRRKDSAVAEALIKAGADPQQKKPDGEGAIHIAASIGAAGAIALLLDAGVDVNAQDSKGQTPLHKAVQAGETSAVELLLARGARSDIEDIYRLTPVAWARNKGNAPITGLMEASEKDAASKAATPLTAGVNAVPGETAETWVRMGEHKAACVGVYPALGRKLTEIFNFESRQHLLISENLKTGAENLAPPQSFDALDERALKRALNAFRELGGKADGNAVFGARAGKKPRLAAPDGGT